MSRFAKNLGFTLVELLVVIAIIGILATVTTVSFTRATESAHASRCKAKLRNLAQASFAFANEASDHCLPRASSFDILGMEKIGKRYQHVYRECSGWVVWTGRANGHAANRSPGEGASPATAFSKSKGYSKTDPAYMSISNGVLWSYVGGDIGVYCCSTFKKAAEGKGRYAVRSYVMNPYFGCDRGSAQKVAPDRRVSLGDVGKHGDPGKLLLFAEMPCYKINVQHTTDNISIDDSKQGADSVIQVKLTDSSFSWDPSSLEHIGFNHRVGKRNAAHVVFADGHVDVLAEPTKANASDLQELTEALCNGLDVDIRLEKRMH
ncbi:MAG: type II secretion system protein [Kiritimatiellae bacterium]|nr:type II secretion system protein [Kiritimatiellia bacterium]